MGTHREIQLRGCSDGSARGCCSLDPSRLDGAARSPGARASVGAGVVTAGRRAAALNGVGSRRAALAVGQLRDARRARPVDGRRPNHQQGTHDCGAAPPGSRCASRASCARLEEKVRTPPNRDLRELMKKGDEAVYMARLKHMVEDEGEDGAGLFSGFNQDSWSAFVKSRGSPPPCLVRAA